MFYLIYFVKVLFFKLVALTTFQVLNRHLCLVATILDNTDLSFFFLCMPPFIRWQFHHTKAPLPASSNINLSLFVAFNREETYSANLSVDKEFNMFPF